MTDATSAKQSDGGATIVITSQQRRWMLCFALVAVAALLAVPLLYLLLSSGPTRVRAIGTGLLAVLAALAAVPLALVVRAFVSQRIDIAVEAGDSTLRYERGGQLVAEVPLEQCRTDGKRLMIGGHAVLLHRFAPIFDAELVRSQLLARLPPSQWLTPARFEFERWRRFIGRHLGVLASVAVALALLYAVRSVPRESWRSLVKWIAVQVGVG